MAKKNKASKEPIGLLGSVELPRLLTKEEVAEYFGVSPRTVETWRFNDTGPVPIKVGKHLRWTVESIVQYLRKQGAEVA